MVTPRATTPRQSPPMMLWPSFSTTPAALVRQLPLTAQIDDDAQQDLYEEL